MVFLLHYLSFFYVLVPLPTVLSQTASGNSSTLPIGSCTPTIPCSNGACCNGASGFCGFGKDFCTTVADGGPCTSNCGALAECGSNAAPENVTCALNVCCSQYGFCGTTADFCDAPGCVSNCNPPSQDSCGADQQSAMQRRIGYYEAWAMQPSSRACDVYTPEQISADTLTHVNFAFALISNTFQIIEMSPGDTSLWQRTTALKAKYIALKVFLSIGGWKFNDPPTSTIFSQLVGSDANTQVFISSVLNVLQAYGFDGIDIDWEYPAAYDRGGVPADKANFVKFMAKVKVAFGPRGYELTFTAPSSYWYLQHFDLPGLLRYADWVNVMTYDLHGAWDGKDPYIGHVVLAHTNLTEIRDTMQLFRNVGVDPNQIVLGIGFYGRSFQLADSSCGSPGCGFIGGAAPGPCSLNSGTLMYSEIETIINADNIEPIFDEAAAVKYIVWNSDQWVSYDDAETLQMKLNYANSICLGGTMIWSVDQDDASYTALQGLYASLDVNTPSSIEGGNLCGITNCNDICPVGWDTMTTVTTNPNSLITCNSDTPAKLCCPSGDEPQNCQWRGGGGSTCIPQCFLGEITLATDPVGGDGTPPCVQGAKAFCCQTGQQNLADCYGIGCGDSPGSCPSGYVAQTFVKQGSSDNGGCEATNDDPNVIQHQTCPNICATNNKPVCCNENGYQNCTWVGDLPNCLNVACNVGQVAIFSDIQGDAPQACIGLGYRLYCCDPPAHTEFLPVLENWVFPETSPVGGGYQVNQPATFTVDFDDDVGGTDTDDGKENDSPFGEVFISSPNDGSVSSFDINSDWVISGCSRSSDQAQEVLAYCSKPMDDEDSGCSHVFIGRAEHTIVRMPRTCGLGPYARVVSLNIHPNQSVLSANHQTRLPKNEKVYSLVFDYNFLAIPEENGPVLMRADLTDIPGYWDAMINSPPDAGTTTTRRKRDFHQAEGHEKRWFGPFDSWLQRLNTVKNSNSASRVFSWSDTYTIFHQEESCPNFASSLDISIAGSAQVNSRFGYYLEATVVPPAIQQAYVYLSAGASAQATFIVTGLAEAHFDSERAEISSFGFPGLYYPGLLTLGPSLHLYGQLTGTLSMSGRYTTSIGYTFPPIDLSFGKMDGNNDEENVGAAVNPIDNNHGYDFSVGYNVALEGSVEAHIVPSLQLGLSVLGGAVLDAQVFVEADLHAGVGINGSVSKTVAPKFCVQPFFGMDLNAGLTGSVPFWRNKAISNSFYHDQFPFGGKCFTSQEEASGSSKRDELLTGAASEGNPLNISHLSSQPAYASYGPSPNPIAINPRINPMDLPPTRIPTTFPEASPLTKRGGVPFLPGNLFCPESGTDITGLTGDCYCYSDATVNDPEGQGAFTKRNVDLAYISPNSSEYDHFHVLASSESNLNSCPSVNVPIPSYDNTPIIAYYDLDDPASLSPTYGSYVPSVPVNLGKKKNGQPYFTLPSGGGAKTIYAREHPYEASMAALFIDYLEQKTDLWQDSSNTMQWCPWVKTHLQGQPAYFSGNSVFQMIAACYPSNAAQTPMAVLEQDTNVIKRVALFAMEAALNQLTSIPVRTDDTFRSYCPQKQIAVLRSAAGVPSFLNEYEVTNIFLNMNSCVRNVWARWFAAYLAAVTVDAPNRQNVNVPFLYDNWIYQVVANVSPFIRDQVQHLITLYNGGATTAATVDLSWAVLLDNVQFTRQGTTQTVSTPASIYASTVSVTQAQLTAQIYNAIPDIDWLNYLQRH